MLWQINLQSVLFYGILQELIPKVVLVLQWIVLFEI